MKRFNVQYPMSNIQRSSEQPRRGQSYILTFSLLMGLSAAVAKAEQANARAAFDAGLEAFAASNWPAASNAFLAAAAAAPAEKLDPAAAYYNAGLAAYAGGDLKASADSFARAASGADLRLQSRAYYNRGNALFHQVGGPAAALSAAPAPLPNLSSQELANAESSVGAAIQRYENAIALDPQDLDAKANYELAVLKQQQIQQQKQQQQQQDQQNQDQQKQDQQNQEEQQDQKQAPQQQPQAQPQPQPENHPEENPQQEEQQIKEDKPSEEMTPEEAAMMLDSMKAQEQSQRDRLHPFFGRPVPVEKDW